MASLLLEGPDLMAARPRAQVLAREGSSLALTQPGSRSQQAPSLLLITGKLLSGRTGQTSTKQESATAAFYHQGTRRGADNGALKRKAHQGRGAKLLAATLNWEHKSS